MGTPLKTNIVAVKAGVGINGERIGKTTYIVPCMNKNPYFQRLKMKKRIRKQLKREEKLNSEKQKLMAAFKAENSDEGSDQDLKGDCSNISQEDPINVFSKEGCERELQVAVKFKQEEFKINREEGFELTASLQEAALRASGDPKGIKLAFNKMGVEAGFFLISPADVVTRDWLLNIWVPPVFGQRKLQVFLATSVSDIFTVYIKVNKSDCFDMNRLMNLLSVQNQDICFASWDLVSKVPCDNSMFLVFDISQDTRIALEKTNWTIHYELRSIEVKFYNCQSSLFKS